MNHLLTFFLFMILPFSGWAQIVETLATDPMLIDGIVVDPSGDIYTTPGAFQGQMHVGRATPAGDFDAFYYDGFEGPADIDQATDGSFYVTNYDGKSLKRYDPVSDELEVLASDLDGPAGVVLDEAGNAFVSCYGAPSSFDGNQIIKVHTDGTVEVWLESNLLFRPQGIAFDDNGNLWVANTASGEIYRIDTLTKEPVLMYEIGPQAGSLAFRHKDQMLYFAAQGQHKIYRLDGEGNSSVFAGTGANSVVDGPALESAFSMPFGIGFSPTEDTMYVCGGGYLRRITELDGPVAVPHQEKQQPFVNIYPNPVSDEVFWESGFDAPFGECLVTLYDSKGQVLGQKAIKNPAAGSMKLPNTLPPGLYYLRLEYLESGESALAKLVKTSP